VASGADGALTSTMDSPDQGAFKIPVDSTAFANGALRCEIKIINGVFEGKLLETDRAIDGTWTQNGFSLPLALKPGAAVVFKRPQVPVKPYPYIEEEVVYENAKAGVKFAGTLTKPKQGAKFPVVLLITGSGAQNRDEELMEHKPFLVLADYLTRRGIAVLRVDDRGVGGSTGNFAAATTEDFIDDALAGVAYLKSRKDIDVKHIGLIGHSEGGLIAPAAAVRSKDVAFIVMMAGPGVPGAKLLSKQGDLIAAAGGATAQARDVNGALRDRLIDIAAQSSDDNDALTKFDAWWKQRMQESAGPFAPQGGQASAMETAGKTLRTQLKGMMTPWMRHFLKYDPAPTLQQVRCPVLAINGSLDLQVPPDQNLPVIEAALKTSGNKDYTVKELPGLNHLFQAAKTGSPSEYAQIEETINPIALDAMGEWVSKRSGLKTNK
jgi:pimeloyl-ACP methyl ester carboxylesterase